MARKAITIRFQESANGKKGGITGHSLRLKLPINKKKAITAKTMPDQKGINPGPGSLQSPISTVRPYSEKKIPTPMKNKADVRL